jgi:hypothetical protein
MLLIYSEKVTNRVTYIFDIIFSRILGLEYVITSDEEEFKSSRKRKLSYARKPLGKELFFRSVNLLFAKDIENQELTFTEYEGNKAFYAVHGEDSAMPFDPFAASFYLVSRYEEYLPYVRDEWGRFEAAQSIAYQEGFLEKPLVNIWALKIAGLLRERYSSIKIMERKYRFIPTVDVDSAWYFKSKGLIRNVGGLFRSLSKLDFSRIGERAAVLAGFRDDPFDTYSEQISVIKRYQIELIYFILFAEYARNDKNLPTHNRRFQVLIKSLGDYAEVGIHSSYNSSYVPEKLRLEVSRLSGVLNKEITRARQHFTRLNLPATYRNFINSGVRADYSMGYMHHPGFRAGICTPFPFYDLDLDHVTSLIVYPFSFAFTSTSRFNHNEKLNLLQDIINNVKSVKGTLVIVWENAFLSHEFGGDGWLGMFEKVISMASDSSEPRTAE